MAGTQAAEKAKFERILQVVLGLDADDPICLSLDRGGHHTVVQLMSMTTPSITGLQYLVNTTETTILPSSANLLHCLRGYIHWRKDNDDKIKDGTQSLRKSSTITESTTSSLIPSLQHQSLAVHHAPQPHSQPTRPLEHMTRWLDLSGVSAETPLPLLPSRMTSSGKPGIEP